MAKVDPREQWKDKPNPIYSLRGTAVYCNSDHYVSLNFLRTKVSDVEAQTRREHIVKLLNQAAGT